jgi:8-oxo-dGTP pyrophosphatase MutT (NUDIX family)
VVLLDENDRLLMLRIHDPAATRGLNPIPADFWLLVGGGVQAGENDQDAARREVLEETGIACIDIGPRVWIRNKLITACDGEPTRAFERFYLGRVRAGGAVSFAGHEPLEASTIIGYRWFTLAEILASESADTFVPDNLGRLLGAVLSTLAAGEPIEVASLP